MGKGSAPTGSGWWHWTVANIPVQTLELDENAGEGNHMLPKGATHVRNDYGTASYGGAAAAPGEPHGYIFTIYALDVERIDVNESSSGAMAGFLLNKHKIAQASMTVYFPHK
ncbi:TPA: YbhB/YbcL family Raf kinase inhibitor-like protein [Serratia odorifera]